MSFPEIPNYQRVWVRARFVDLGKAAKYEANYGLTKALTLAPSVKVLLDAGTQQIIGTSSFTVTPELADGYTELSVPATDDPDLNPTGFTYAVTEPTGRSYNMVVPYDTPILNSPGDPRHGERVIELIDVVPVDEPNPGTAQLLTGPAGRGITDVDKVGGNFVFTFTDATTDSIGVPAVDSVNGQTGAVSVTPASISAQPQDNDLTTIAALAPVTDGSTIVRISGNWVSRTPTQLKTDIGLNNVENTSDANKPVSTAQATSIATKQPLDADLTTIAGLAVVNDSILQGKSGAWAARSMSQLKTDLVLVKADVGLGSADNTADSAKPVSTAQATSIATKAALSHTHVATTDLTATGTKDSTTFLRGDNTWAVPPAGGGGVPTSRVLTAGTGLTGGGDLSADRSFAVSYGSAGSTAVQGNDTRVTADQAAGTASIRSIGAGALQAAAGNHGHSGADITSGTVGSARLPLVPGVITSQSSGVATITLDASLGNNRNLTATGAITLNAPTNPTDHQVLNIDVLASGATRTITLQAAILLLAGVAGPFSIPSGKILRLALRYSILVTAWVCEAAAIQQ